MTQNILQQIQTMQFEQRGEAERLLLDFIRNTFPSLDVAVVQLRPQAVSLNSFNGFLTLADGERLFFKTHTEEDNVIGEYYNARMLADAGYPVIQPLYSSTQAGQHLLIYEVIDDPSVFDLAWTIEQREDTAWYSALTNAQHRADDHLLDCYRRTMSHQTPSTAAKAPIHQLFYHRLVGGRLDRFYGPLSRGPDNDVEVTLPTGTYPMRVIRHMHWTINGQQYTSTLSQIITAAIHLLNPRQASPSIVGHGDAHNGNVFFRRGTKPPALVYFDPAFAGRHHPLLDLAKPLFHNVFAMWMYFPQVKQAQTEIHVERVGDSLQVTYDYPLPPIRQMFLQSKVERVVIPILRDLRKMRQLRADWRSYLKAALFCCPFLTLNLADSERFPPEITLLGLAMAVEMGAESSGQRSLIDQTLDEVEHSL